MRLNESRNTQLAHRLAHQAELLDECMLAFVSDKTRGHVTLVMENSGPQTPQQLIDFCVDHAAYMQVQDEDRLTVRYKLMPLNTKGGFRV